MTDFDYLSSLKNKEYFILRKLCDDSISQNDKEKFENELNEIRIEIKQLE